MIDAEPSLRAAEGVSASALTTYLRSKGWLVRPSRVKGTVILSKRLPEAEEAVEFILPSTPGSSEEQHRVADALRTIEAVEGRPLVGIVDDIQRTLNAAKVGSMRYVPAHSRPLDITVEVIEIEISTDDSGHYTVVVYEKSGVRQVLSTPLLKMKPARSN